MFAARPEVFAHNLETVPRIFRRIRPGFRYERSLDVLRQAHEAGLVTKSNLILGMGETRDEIAPAMADLRSAGCDLLTITQYLRPSAKHHPVDRWVRPEEFVELREEALAMGFAGVLAGPLVRSSYRAGRLYAQAMEQRAIAAMSPARGPRAGFLLLSTRGSWAGWAESRSVRDDGFAGLTFLRLQTCAPETVCCLVLAHVMREGRTGG